jgi:hypothetical protein
MGYNVGTVVEAEAECHISSELTPGLEAASFTRGVALLEMSSGQIAFGPKRRR